VQCTDTLKRTACETVKQWHLLTNEWYANKMLRYNIRHENYGTDFFPVGYLTTLIHYRDYEYKAIDGTMTWAWKNSEGRDCGLIETLNGLWKTTQNLSQNSRCSRQDSNRVPPEHKSRTLRLDQPVRSHIRCYLTIQRQFSGKGVTCSHLACRFEPARFGASADGGEQRENTLQRSERCTLHSTRP
jgi:hypothetical protein